MSSRIPPRLQAAASSPVVKKVTDLAAAGVVAKSKIDEASALHQAVTEATLKTPDPGFLGRAGRAWGSFAQRNARLMDFGGRLGGTLGVLSGARTAVVSGQKTLSALGQAIFAARHGYTTEARSELTQALDDGLASAKGAILAGRSMVTLHNVTVGRAGAQAAVEAFRATGGFHGLSVRAAREVEAMVASAGSTIAIAKSRGAASLAGKLVRGTAARSIEAAVQAGKREVGEAVLLANAVRPVGTVGVEAMARAESRGAVAALRAGTRAGASTLGKAAARFAPGLNVAMAVVDTGLAGRDLYLAVKQPSPRSIGKAVLSGLTAAGSIVAATNVPVVSQIGAAASTITGFVSALL